jgi:signal transduction histidine kinase
MADPAATTPAHGAPAPANGSVANGQAALAGPAPVRVLLVEDNPGDARLAKEYLAEQAYGLRSSVHWARTLDEATGELSLGETDIVLLDLSLPDCTGLATFAAVHKAAPHLPIIILSGQSDGELALQTVREGAQDHLSKNNLEPELISRAIRYAIERKAIIEQLRATQMLLIQAEKMESLGRLAAGVAHEVKNPLARIQLGLDYLRDGVDPDDPNLPVVYERIESAIVRADAIVREMVNFSSNRSLAASPTSLRQPVDNALMLVDHELKRRGISAHLEIPGDLPLLRIDSSKIEQVLINILLNSVHAIDETGEGHGRIEITAEAGPYRGASLETQDRTARRLRAGDTVVVVTLTDSGTGVAPDKVATVFDPFVTTKPTGVGTGLGLTVSRKIIELHGGTLTLKNREDGRRGACATITLPVDPQPDLAPVAPTPLEPTTPPIERP